MYSRTRRLVGAWLAALAASASLPSLAQDYPSRPVRLLVGYAAGGPVDINARLLAAAMQKEFGQAVVVDNRPGAGGAVAGDVNAKATPDGQILLFAASPTQTITPHMADKLGFDPLKDYTPIAILSVGYNVLMVRADSPIRTVADLAAYAKANPGKATFGSAGIGASNHLASELLAKRTGTEMLHVPYKGNAPAMVALLGGETSFQFAGTSDAAELVRSGKVRALAVTSPERLKVLPNTPTMAEAGFADFNVSVWYALQGPPKLPAAIATRLGAADQAALRDPAYQKALADGGFEIANWGPDVMTQRVNAESKQWGDLIKTLKLN
jgi:tripartite-type tricarboxylate transporter receptor subunit TctC